MSIVLQGSTSGSVTLQEPAIAGTTVLDLPAVSGTVLTTGSSGQSIPKAALPTGSVLQVVNVAYATQVTSTSATFSDTGLSATITPTSSSSKILVLVNHNGNLIIGTPTGMGFKLLRNGSQISYVEDAAPFSNAGGLNMGSGAGNINYLDSPATTSATTYKTQFNNRSATGTAVVQYNGNFGQSTSYMTLLEIAA